jgi:peptidyl-dipeptidase A
MRLLISMLAAALPAAAVLAADVPNMTADESKFAQLRDTYLAAFTPLWKETQSAWWEANTTGSDAAFKRKTDADQALARLQSDTAVFKEIEALRQSKDLKDPVRRRELEVIYRDFLPFQADPEVQKQIIEMENAVEQVFNTHRSDVAGKTLTENEVRDVIRTTKDSAAAQAAWQGYVAVGGKIADKVREGAKLRNSQARKLGFANYFEMQLAIQELPKDAFWRLFDELDELTKAPYAELMASIKKQRAAHFGITEAELRPWHFGDLFFQESPPGEEVDLDALFADVDLVKLTEKYYASINMPCDDIMARSDLYEREGKSPHAFCNDMDRQGDIRVLCNLKSNAYWADTMLHEFGHAVYDKYTGKDVPFVLHTPSHSLTTEGIAQMFGALIKNEDFLRRVRGLDSDKAAAAGKALRASLRAEKLIFARWTQVVTRFERSMYENPDQDLSALWWKLKQEYQLLPPPDDAKLPGYAAKIHILSHPVYYHSYMMGDMFGAQIHAHIARKVLGIDDPTKTCLYDEPKAGDFLKAEVFGPGNLYSWNDLTRRATGEDLSAKAFAAYVIGVGAK